MLFETIWSRGKKRFTEIITTMGQSYCLCFPGPCSTSYWNTDSAMYHTVSWKVWGTCQNMLINYIQAYLLITEKRRNTSQNCTNVPETIWSKMANDFPTGLISFLQIQFGMAQDGRYKASWRHDSWATSKMMQMDNFPNSCKPHCLILLQISLLPCNAAHISRPSRQRLSSERSLIKAGGPEVSGWSQKAPQRMEMRCEMRSGRGRG